jgi:anti-sigma B factor antagonist
MTAMLDHHGAPTRLSPLCSLRVEQQVDSTMVTLYGEFDLSCDGPFQEELDRIVSDETAHLVLDLRGLTFMDSTGLWMLIALDGTARHGSFELIVLCSSDGPVRRLLRETGLDGVLPVVDPLGRVPSSESPV